MGARRLLTVVAVLAVALFAQTAVAAAKTLQFRGIVAGAPYAASKADVAVPVLYSKQTARAGRLKSAVGLVVVKKGLTVRMPRGTAAIRPLALRMGDQFKGAVRMKKSYSKSFYPSIRFNSVTVQFRAKELSLSEITAAIDALRKALAALQAQQAGSQPGGGSQSSSGGSTSGAQTTPDYQAQIDAINKRLNDLVAGMPDFTQFARLSDLPDMSQYLKVGDLTSALGSDPVISDLQDQVDTLSSQLQTVCNAVSNATVHLPAPLNTTVPVTIDTGGVC